MEGTLQKPTSFVPLNISLTVGALGCKIWENSVIDHLVEKGLIKNMVVLAKKDRLGMSVEDKKCLETASSFIICRDFSQNPYALYEDLYESESLKESKNFYKEEAAKMKSSCSVSAYMKYVKIVLIKV